MRSAPREDASAVIMRIIGLVPPFAVVASHPCGGVQRQQLSDRSPVRQILFASPAFASSGQRVQDSESPAARYGRSRAGGRDPARRPRAQGRAEEPRSTARPGAPRRRTGPSSQGPNSPEPRPRRVEYRNERGSETGPASAELRASSVECRGPPLLGIAPAELRVSSVELRELPSFELRTARAPRSPGFAASGPLGTAAGRHDQAGACGEHHGGADDQRHRATAARRGEVATATGVGRRAR